MQALLELQRQATQESLLKQRKGNEMTFLEKLKEDNPNLSSAELEAERSRTCPHSHRYENYPNSQCYGNCTECWNREMPNTEEKFVNQGVDANYNQGSKDVWEFMKKIEDLNAYKRMGIYETSSLKVILNKFTPQEAMEKLKAYEEAQKIELGDVVKVDGTCYTYVVTVIQAESDGMYYCGISKNGRWFAQNNVTKTGKHIDLANILEQIGE